MKVRDIAEKYNVSVQAVYNRIKRSGMSLEEIKDVNGDINGDSLETVEKMFSTSLENSCQQDSTSVQCELLTQKIELLNKEVEMYKTSLQEVKEEKEKLQSTIDSLQEALKQQQALNLVTSTNLSTLTNLLLPAENHEKESWIKRTIRKIVK